MHPAESVGYCSSEEKLRKTKKRLEAKESFLLID
jgi:hypothetical protein